jgi:hypothetical protein
MLGLLILASPGHVCTTVTLTWICGFCKTVVTGFKLFALFCFMELLLNLAWLLLAVPAYWLWRGARQPVRRFTSGQCLLALGCVLVILFPVVSATDDLRSMRAEMEESPSSKRSVRHHSFDKGSAGKWHSQPLLEAVASSFFVDTKAWQPVPVPQFRAPTVSVCAYSGRAPPSFSVFV